MSVVAQVRLQVLGSSLVYEVIQIRDGGSEFDIDKDYQHLSNIEISEMLCLADDHQDQNTGEEELMLSFAKSNRPVRAKKKNTDV
jgi:hypothetical protein